MKRAHVFVVMSLHTRKYVNVAVHMYICVRLVNKSEIVATCVRATINIRIGAAPMNACLCVCVCVDKLQNYLGILTRPKQALSIYCYVQRRSVCKY